MSRRKQVQRLESIYVGRNNSNIEATRDRLIRGQSYKDLSTVCVIPTRGLIPAKVCQSLLSLAAPMNQKFLRIFVEKMEVGDAYNQAIEMILANPELSKWKYVLTCEEDNLPPPDGLLKLYESMDRFDVVSGLYFVKGENGAGMVYGNVNEHPANFIPQVPIPDTVMPCRGTGMGFCLFKLEMFKKMPKPWFKTLQEFVPGQGMRAATQDLYFAQEAGKFGYRFAVDCRVRVGHFQYETDTIW
jgi:hypothetical protein